jgi:hypothetical protein
VLKLPMVKLVSVSETAAAPKTTEPASAPAAEPPERVRPSPEPEQQAAHRAEPARRPERSSPPRAAAPARQAPSAGTGYLRLNSRPWAEVTIDGKPAGATPLLNVELAAGAHTVTLSNPQFGLKKSVKLQIVAGETLTKVVDLQ